MKIRFQVTNRTVHPDGRVSYQFELSEQQHAAWDGGLGTADKSNRGILALSRVQGLNLEAKKHYTITIASDEPLKTRNS